MEQAFHPQLKKRLSFVYRPRLIFLWALGTLVISGSKVLEYYDDSAGRATVLERKFWHVQAHDEVLRGLRTLLDIWRRRSSDSSVV